MAGSRFPMGLPPMPNGGGGTALTVAAPQNDFQLVAWMAAIIVAQMPAPDVADTEARNAQANLAALRAIDVLGHVGYHMGRGTIGQATQHSVRQGQADLKTAVEAEQSQGREPQQKIITEE